MNIRLNGKTEMKIEVSMKECLNVILRELRFNEDCLIKDNKLYERVDLGCHQAEFENVLRSEKEYDIELFKAIKLLMKHFSD
jgi:hypothetical protein